MGAFHTALFALPRSWYLQEEYSHGYLVPLVTAWMLWVRRHDVITNLGRPIWMGAALVALAASLHIISQLSGILILSQMAFVITLFGIVLAIGGYALMRVTFAPIAFLIFAIPLPDFLNAGLSLDLQLISSKLGAAFINLFNAPVYLEGNIIDLGTYKLQVVDACSGLRYLFPLCSLSFLAAYLFQAPIWQRVFVALSSIPITVAMNGFRIGAVGITVDRWGPSMADGMLHFLEGWIIFLASTLVILIEVYLLARISKRPFSESFGVLTGAKSTASAAVLSKDHRPFYACLFLILTILFAGTFTGIRSETIPERSRFVTFPADIGDWHGHASSLAPDVERTLGLDDYILSDYSDPSGKIVNLYVAYYASQHRFKYHSPLVCIPADGWSIISFERTKNDVGHPMNRAIIERNGSRQLVYYWYEERGRKIASEYLSRLYLIYDSIFMNRSDGALIRLVTPILPDELDEQADIRLRRFIRDLEPRLNVFVPSRDSPTNERPTARNPQRHAHV